MRYIRTMKKTFMLFALLLFIAGCSKNKDAGSSNIALVEKIWKHAENNPHGFTLDLEAMEPVKFGISVAYLETQDSFDKQGLEKVIAHALKHHKVIGGWLNEDNELYYFDSVRIFKNNELDEAIEFAKQNRQLALFDLTNLKEIRVEP